MHDSRALGRYGAILWILNAQYFLVQAVAAAFWTKGAGYSWADNTISDLANTHCGLYGSRLVCSPLHGVMNISFIVLGVTIIAGAVLLERQLAAGRIARLGFACMAFAGVGSILIGLFPENSISSLHIAGATLSFALGNLGMIIIGASLKRAPNILRAYTILSGMIGLVALGFFLNDIHFGAGIGGMERIVAYPQTVWMIVFGSFYYYRLRFTKRQPATPQGLSDSP